MDMLQLEREALALNVRERAQLASSLLNSLPPEQADVPDEDVSRRDAELEAPSVQPLSHTEFVRKIEESRGR